MAAAPRGLRDVVAAQTTQQDDAIKSNVSRAASSVNRLIVCRPRFTLRAGCHRLLDLSSLSNKPFPSSDAGAWHVLGAIVRILPAAFVIYLLPTGHAHAGLGDEDLEALLGWLYVLPIGVLETCLALVVRRRIGKSPVVGLTIVVTLVSLGAGIAVAVLLAGDRNVLVPVLSILCLAPAVPVVLVLLRERTLVPAALGLVLPLPFILSLWHGAGR